MVQLQRKVAFPFVTRDHDAARGAVRGDDRAPRRALRRSASGIVLAMVYWIALSIFGALGAGGWMSPMLAAWAPNILFGAAAAYMLLTVRT